MVNGAFLELERNELITLKSQETKQETGRVMWKDTGTWNAVKRSSERTTWKRDLLQHMSTIHLTSGMLF